MKRTARKKPSFELDLAVPVDKSKLISDGCFGKAWNITSSECPKCADREVCHILFKDLVDAKAKKLAQKKGIKYLDEADFKALSKTELFLWIESGKTTTKELIAHVQEVANTDDRIAVIEWIKNWITSDKRVSTKSGKVWKN